LQAHYVAAFGCAYEARAYVFSVFIEGAYVAWAFEMVENFF